MRLVRRAWLRCCAASELTLLSLGQGRTPGGAQQGPERLTGAVCYQETGVFEPGRDKALDEPG